VASVLEATVRRDGQRLRINARLSDTRNGTTVWTAAYDEELIDLFELQKRIALRATESLLGAIPNDGKPLTRRLQPTLSVGAYDDYLRGQEALNLPATDSAINKAKGFFRSALAADAGFARAQAGICRAEIKHFISVRLADVFTEAQAACALAEAMDPTLREVDLAMGELYQAKAEAAPAIERFTRALEDPALRVDANLGLARVEADRGEAALALEFFDRAAALSPGNWQVYSKRGYFHYQRQEHEQALAAYRTALSLNPMSASLWSSVGGLHQMLGQAPEAIDAFTRSLAIQPSHGALSNLGFAQFTTQQYAAAASSFHQALAIDNSDYRVWANLGDALAAEPSTAAQAREPYEEALQRIDGYLEVRADDAEAMALQGWLLASLGQYDAARRAIADSVARAPSHGEVAMWCAQAMALVGDVDKAQACLVVAVQSGIESRRLASVPVLRRLLPAR
jgi:tetratricopeptide (TPR) repeat protein